MTVLAPSRPPKVCVLLKPYLAQQQARYGRPFNDTVVRRFTDGKEPSEKTFEQSGIEPGLSVTNAITTHHQVELLGHDLRCNIIHIALRAYQTADTILFREVVQKQQSVRGGVVVFLKLITLNGSEIPESQWGEEEMNAIQSMVDATRLYGQAERRMYPSE
jgi:hypothetical protein